MLLSMTGFASKTFSIFTETDTPASITLSIKTLNSRFFEANFKIPYSLYSLETELIPLCKAKLKRGTMFFSINMSNPNVFKAAVEPSKAVVQSYLDAVTHIKESFAIKGEITIPDLIQLPNIFTTEEKGIDEQTKKIIIDEAQNVLDMLLEVRSREGNALEKDIEQRCIRLTDNINQIEDIAEKSLTARKEEISKQLHELGINESEAAETQRIILYNELNKMDIHEEIIRFKSHLKNLQHILQTTDVEKGKRIDFTLQELSREINTIAAKCSDLTIGSLAINVKVELEKIREQNQNIV